MNLTERLTLYEKLMRLDKPNHCIFSCGFQVA
jgi:hypothetical protein